MTEYYTFAHTLRAQMHIKDTLQMCQQKNIRYSALAAPDHLKASVWWPTYPLRLQLGIAVNLIGQSSSEKVLSAVDASG